MSDAAGTSIRFPNHITGTKRATPFTSPWPEPPEDELIPGFERLGEISARMHLHAKGWTPPADFSRHSWTPDEILDDRLAWGPWQTGVGVEPETSRLLDLSKHRFDSLFT